MGNEIGYLGGLQELSMLVVRTFHGVEEFKVKTVSIRVCFICNCTYLSHFKLNLGFFTIFLGNKLLIDEC